MSNDPKPLKYYINNRDKMLQQACLSIQDTQLQKLIPASLKHLPLEELKAECLVQLLGMSKKRILCVLEGRTLESSSSSSESELEEADVMQHKGHKEILKNNTKSYKSDGTANNSNNANEKKRTKIKQEKTKVEDSQTKKNKTQNARNKANKTKRISGNEEYKEPPDDSRDKEKDGKTLLEILELEMRAKAIRALLRQVEGEEQDSDNAKQDGRGSMTTTTAPATTTVITQDEIDLTLDDDLRNSQGDSNNSMKEGRDNSTEKDEEETKSIGDPSEPEEMGWAGRWLKSKDVKRVVATSKMITSVRKKMKTIHKSKNVDKGKHSRMNIEGSVNEYRMLSKEHSQQKK